MHLYNAWLPPPVAQETKREKDSFSRVVCSVKNSFKPDDPDSVYSTLKWISVIDLIISILETKREKDSFSRVVCSVKNSFKPDDPDSVYSTLKWISVIDLFIKAKSDVSLEDVSTLVEIGLELFKNSQNKLYAQVRWGNILVRVLNKYRKKLSLKVQWRPLYDTLVNTHFTRDTGPEGWRLRQRHFEAITSLVRSCRRFFPPGSAFEIWSEFSDWIKSCIDLWDSMPNCQFWNSQWAALVARVVKNCNSIEWECFLPTLFARYLNMFEVTV
ncbi:proteasome activator subunit 4 [Quercus suber]|uniref:Proteasome activator subunit 4 n=1 Tax=Quercus suber TaxID=58331 RepID=A0AAW0JIH8_QUESU